MNMEVLYLDIASRLHTHVRLYTKDGMLLETYTQRQDLKDTYPGTGRIDLQQLNLTSPVSEPRLSTVNNLVTYMTVPVQDVSCVIGPVGVCADCIRQVHIPTLVFPNELIERLYHAETGRLIRIGVFLYNLFAKEYLEPTDIFNRNFHGEKIMEDSMKTATKLLFYHEEFGTNHNPYDAEQREMAGIENGSLQQLQRSKGEDFSGNLGTLSLDPLRNAKYLSIICIALSARAAIRGGVPYELAYSLSDAYCQQIDMIEDADASRFESIVRNIQITYTELVAQQKGASSARTETSPLAEHAKNYIFSHLHGKLTVNDVAAELKTHPNNLNRVFKQAEGITVHDYILREKVNLARNMLTYSDLSYLAIATYLGFASQSHLGGTFRKFTGMTLKQYRDSYKKRSTLSP